MQRKLLQNLVVIGPLSLVMLFIDASSLMGGERGEFDDLQTGQSVSVEGRYLGGKSILASEVEIDDEPLELEKFKGSIQLIDEEENSLVIADVKILVTPDTLIEGRDIDDPSGDKEAKIEGSPIEFSNLRQGWRVRIKGRLQDESVFAAEDIKVRKPKSVNKVEIKSTVQDIDKDQKVLNVMGFIVRVNSRTEIKFD